MVDIVTRVNNVVNGFVWGPVMLVLLVGTGVYLSIAVGFIQFTKIGYWWKNTIGKIFKKGEAGDGEITPLQAVSTALASTVGTGNIAGVTGAMRRCACYALFFGLIRDYKGLDLLLDAWAELKRAGRAEGRKLIVAGEFYTPKERYLRQIADNGLQEEVLLHDRFIPDDDVKYYFSAADFVVQPYKTATQSGVTQIAYQFCVPMVVTKVGGLAEIVPDGRVGYVCEPTARGVAEAVAKMYEGDAIERFRLNCIEERKRFSWEEMCSRITELYGLVASGK